MSQKLPDLAPDFDDPLGMLGACHKRIFAHCDTLERITEHLTSAGIDDESQAAARKVHHYFSTAGKLHHRDEEEDIFPKLARQSLKLADVVFKLRQEHQYLEEIWRKLELGLQKLNSIEDLKTFKETAQEFARLNRAHIKKEDQDLLSIAQHVLSHKELEQIGARMAERRGVRI